MKLVDLDPRFYLAADGLTPIGITFDCPHCLGSGQRLAIAIRMDGTNFDPDPDNDQQFPANEHVWTVVSGGGFPDLSLSPSIDASSAGHWHGYITAGEIVGGL